jgi:hypothetical protein
MDYFYLFNAGKVEWSCQWIDGRISPLSETLLSASMVLDDKMGTFVVASDFNGARNGEKTLETRGKRTIVHWLHDTERDLLLAVFVLLLLRLFWKSVALFVVFCFSIFVNLSCRICCNNSPNCATFTSFFFSDSHSEAGHCRSVWYDGHQSTGLSARLLDSLRRQF